MAKIRSEKMNLINGLKHINATSVKYKKGWGIVYLEGNKLPGKKIRIVKKMVGLANWLREKDSRMIRLEDEWVNWDNARKYIRLVILHEVVESYIARTFGLNEDEAHIVSESIETKYARQRGYNLRQYGQVLRRMRELEARESGH